MSTINYTSNYSMKDHVVKDIAPRFFNMDKVNDMNIGLIGYTTEIVANMTEDTLNTVTTFVNEMFPNLAVLPESIYAYASLFQIEDLFATPSRLSVTVLVSEKDIITNATFVDGHGDFYIDSSLVIDVEGVQFSPDYDINITVRPHRGDFIFAAMYNKTTKNSISAIDSPYIRSVRLKYHGENYVALFFDAHQVNKYTKNEILLNNDKISIQSVFFEFNKQLANFDVFYKESGSNSYTQLEKLLEGSPPLKNPFCYYKFSNENRIEITFPSRDNYFQPKFNSEIMIQYYETDGAAGNFKEYTGNSISAYAESDKYAYNNTVVMFALSQGAAMFGRDKRTLEELRNIVIEKFSTVASYTNENDLQLYFSGFKTEENVDVMFIKKRDDVFARLFSAFLMMKDVNGDIYKTNTLHIELQDGDFDTYYEQDKSYVLKPGHKFTYKGNSSDLAVPVPKDSKDVLPFSYINPFLIYVTREPALIGYYINSINTKTKLDYEYVNNNSIVQFMCSHVTISRNAVSGEAGYHFKIQIIPASELESPIVDDKTLADLGNLKLKLMLGDESNELCYYDFKLTGASLADKIYTFETTVNTDDYFILSNRFRVKDGKSLENNDVRDFMVPMLDGKIRIYTFYKYSDQNLSHKYASIPDVTNLTLTNGYSTTENRINFIYPLNIVQSQSRYIDNGDGTFGTLIYGSPLIASSINANTTTMFHILNQLKTQYDYMEAIVHDITNNYGIDMKFYNTYGKSKNFVVGEASELLDQVSLKINFKVSLVFGTNTEDFLQNVKIFIKNHIEGINAVSNNSIYISKLIQELENNFAEIKYLKFVKINNFDSSVQVVDNATVNLNRLTKEERIYYVPEYLTIALEDVIIDLI